MRVLISNRALTCCITLWPGPVVNIFAGAQPQALVHVYPVQLAAIDEANDTEIDRLGPWHVHTEHISPHEA